VLAGGLATASGLGRHRAIDVPEVSTVYSRIVQQLAPTPVIVHCCAPGTPVAMLARAGVSGVGTDLGLLSTPDWDALGAAMEGGLWLFAGALTTSDPTAAPPSPDRVADAVLDPIRRLGLPPEVSTHTVITPACGLAGLSRAAAVNILRTLRTAAGIVGEGLYD
jgi:hypothetical protein